MNKVVAIVEWIFKYLNRDKFTYFQEKKIFQFLYFLYENC